MIFKLLTTAFLLATLLSPFQSLALVDMKNANYSETWVDLIVPGTGYDLRIRRSYSSRSLFNGMFGFGTCSDMETTLNINAEGNIKVTECGSGLEITYTEKNFSAKNVDQTIKQIISSHKKSRPGLKSKFFKDFKVRLKGSNNLRTHYADLYKIKRPVQEGTIFYANGKEVERIVLKKGVYTRYLANNTLQKFNFKGHLIHMSDRNNNYLKFTRDKKEFLREIVDNNGRKLSLKYDGKKVSLITAPNGLKVSYKYKNENLVYVKNAWNKTYTYAYDDLHNLTRVNFPDGTNKKLTYDKNRDWITSFQDRAKCVESYKYISKPDDPKNHYVSSVIKKCGKKITAKSSYEFWHKTRPDGLKYLARVKSITNDGTSDITYHPVFGRPIRSGKNGNYTKYTYYDNGLVHTKSFRREKTIFEYKNKFKKVSKVTFLKFTRKGKVKKQDKEITTFKYDSKGNLKFAKNSTGQTVSLTYDLSGRIATIKDHAKKLVKISYDKKFGKPSYVQRPGVGAITISYKSSGEIKNVISKDGPSVAVQVASTFNNLLDIISPATDELSI